MRLFQRRCILFLLLLLKIRHIVVSVNTLLLRTFLLLAPAKCPLHPSPLLLGVLLRVRVRRRPIVHLYQILDNVIAVLREILIVHSFHCGVFAFFFIFIFKFVILLLEFLFLFVLIFILLITVIISDIVNESFPLGGLYFESIVFVGRAVRVLLEDPFDFGLPRLELLNQFLLLWGERSVEELSKLV